MRCGYGTYVPATSDAAAELRDEIALVEDAGFDAIFFSEHHGVDGYAPDPLALALHALSRTTVLRAGTMPLILPLRDPTLVAETAALGAFLSGGRLVLGVGAGYLPQDYAQVGVPFEDRGARLEEGIAVMRGVWSGALEHEGRFYRASQARAPLHRPAAATPIWIASSSPLGMRRAARLGDGVMLNSLLDGEEAASLAGRYRAACRKYGVEPGTVGAIRRGWFGPGAEADAFLAAFEAQLRGAVNYAEYAKKQWVRDLASRRWVQDVAFVGEPEQVAASLAAWSARAGIDYVMLKLHWGARDFAEVRAQLGRARAFTAALADASG
jgi:alkanesulfonate monooxygenase SsuD/methylene tetrahydromethanopterin reductase-like flavin-dependent oxidoreductase (luciferase family)